MQNRKIISLYTSLALGASDTFNHFSSDPMGPVDLLLKKQCVCVLENETI